PQTGADGAKRSGTLTQFAVAAAAKAGDEILVDPIALRARDQLGLRGHSPLEVFLGFRIRLGGRAADAEPVGSLSASTTGARELVEVLAAAAGAQHAHEARADFLGVHRFGVVMEKHVGLDRNQRTATVGARSDSSVYRWPRPQAWAV